AETLGLTELNGGALFDAEFGIGHGAAPYRKGQVLHSVFAAAKVLNSFQSFLLRSTQALAAKLTQLYKW
ncbi:hypothetical protein KGZ04_29580, partial [Pseudomonas aeruginosa]|uniref:hypothetical protein n=1 Tax=Pseudomonas aeruginosa TaxID=287 RepID=UPI002340BB6C